MSLLDNNPLYKCCWDLWDRALVGVKIAFDIGANNGGMSRTMASKGIMVHAYEPVPDMYQKLVEVSNEYTSISPNRLMVSDSTTPLKNLNVFSAWSVLPENTPWNKAQEYAKNPPFDCDCTTVDIESKKYGYPDFIKLDVDGYEHRVIRGSLETLKKSRCPVLFEYSDLLEKLGDSPQEMVWLIYGLGYRAWSMDGKYVCKTAGDMLDCYPAHTSFDCMLVHRDTSI